MNARPGVLAGLAALGLATAPLLSATTAVAGGPQPAPHGAGSPATVVRATDDGTGITWGIEPADGEGEPDGRVSFRMTLDPGESVTEHVLVTNYSEQPVTFRLVASDGVVGESGAFDLLPSDAEPVDVGSWIEITEEVAVEAGLSALVPFTLTVPEDATPGDHPGGIVASVAQDAGDDGGPQVGVDTRVGTRIHLRVAGEIQPVATITDLTTRYETSWNPFEGGTLHVDYTIVNDGNVRLGSIQQYEVSGPFDLSPGGEGPSGTVVGQQREILPGQDAQVSTTVDGVWPLAQLTTTVSGFLQPVGEDVVGATMPEPSAQSTVWAVPWPQLAVLAVVVLVVVALVLRRRRRRARFASALARARAEGAAQTGRPQAASA